MSLEAQQEGDQVILLLVRELQLEHEVEELDGIVERGQASVVQVGRRVLDAAQRERLDGPLGPARVEPSTWRSCR